MLMITLAVNACVMLVWLGSSGVVLLLLLLPPVCVLTHLILICDHQQHTLCAAAVFKAGSYVHFNHFIFFLHVGNVTLGPLTLVTS